MRFIDVLGVCCREKVAVFVVSSMSGGCGFAVGG